MPKLHELLENSVRRFPQRPAVLDPARGEAAGYAELNALSERVRAALAAQGIGPRDRVGLCAHKSIGVVAALFGALKCGAAYVPVSADNPPSRNAFIFTDCAARAIVVEERLLGPLRDAFGDRRLDVAEAFDGIKSGETTYLLVVPEASRADDAAETVPDGLAYILYTSGSTGQPKGVMHTHSSALGFIDWCSEAFHPSPEDRFSSHAPFHFDLSILDIFVPLKHGGAIVLLTEDLGKQPKRLAEVISEDRISVWYSTPTILRLLLEYGRAEQRDYSSLRTVCFAGEVFPVKHLRALQDWWPHPRYLNLYGPTETNVCTYYEVPGRVPDDRTEPLPIGRACSGDRTRVVNERGEEVRAGEEGELHVSGASVMAGYWNLPERNAAAFHIDQDGAAWYKTGDIVKEDPREGYLFIGRRDRMVKRHGYRVELGEIESALYKHPAVTEAAAVAVPVDEGTVKIRAFLNWTAETKPSLIALKQFCAQRLPLYMVPDEFSVLPALPKTSTDKIDYQKLMQAP